MSSCVKVSGAFDVHEPMKFAMVIFAPSSKPPMKAATSPLATIDGQPVNIASMNDLMAQMRCLISARQGFSLFTLNLDHLVKRRDNAAFRDAYARATLVSADGAPIVRLARRQGATLQRTTGADLIQPLCALSVETNTPLYFFGSTEHQLAAATKVLGAAWPGLIIAGEASPPFGFDPLSPAADEAGQKIAQSGAGLCLIALGAPKQELLADRWLRAHPNVGYCCIGAALDFIAGGQRRAPQMMQRLGLEWLWRLASHPRRLATRYGRCALLLAEIEVATRFAQKPQVSA